MIIIIMIIIIIIIIMIRVTIKIITLIINNNNIIIYISLPNIKVQKHFLNNAIKQNNIDVKQTLTCTSNSHPYKLELLHLCLSLACSDCARQLLRNFGVFGQFLAVLATSINFYLHWQYFRK